MLHYLIVSICIYKLKQKVFKSQNLRYRVGTFEFLFAQVGSFKKFDEEGKKGFSTQDVEANSVTVV